MPMRKYLHILKIRIKAWLGWFGVKLTSNERGEYCRWITRNVTESTAETLRKVRSGAPIEGVDYISEHYKQKFECDFIADEDFG